MTIDANALAEDLARTLSGEKDGINIERLKTDMRICADHYGCTAAERREMWGLALADQTAALECYDRMAQLALGACRFINERLDDSIALARASGFTGPFQTDVDDGAAHSEAVKQRAARK